MNNIAEVTINYSTKVKPSERLKISSSQDAYNILKPFYEDVMEHKEEFKIILLNRANKVLGVFNVSSGGTTGCVVDAKIVFQAAIKANANGIILSHNHPSGNIQPSEQDKSITRKLKEGGRLLDIEILDHVILTPETYISFADEGIL